MPDAASRRAPVPRTPGSAIKVPARITVLFWIIKLLTTGTGEAASDYLGTVPLVLGGLVAVGGFAAALWWQLRAERYRPAVYWLAVTMVAVFGTVAADGVHVGLGVPYAVSSAFWAGVVAAVLIRWYRTEGTLSIHSITTARRERFYWATVLATFALGTAAGDLTASQLRLGFLPSAVLFGVLILVPLAGWRLGWIGDVLGFWTAYVLTRPLGASVADWLGKPPRIGHGLGFGDGTVAGIGLAGIAVLVAGVELAARRRRTADEQPASGDGARVAPVAG